MSDRPAANDVTADQARRSLAFAESSSVVTAKDRRALMRGAAVIGSAAGLLVLGVWATSGNPGLTNGVRIGALAVMMALYLGAIVYAVITMHRIKAAPRGFTKRYTAGTVITFSIYAVALGVLGLSSIGTSWAVALTAAIATAAPALFAAWSISRLALR